MKAEVLKKISPLINKGDILIKRGKQGILKGYEKKHNIKVTISSWRGDVEFTCPNHYPWESVENLPEYYKIIE